MQHLGLDEKRLLTLRVEHKLVQALLLQSYCPNVIPVTAGLRALLATRGPAYVERLLEADRGQAVIVKRALGYGSGEHNVWCETPHGLIAAIASEADLVDSQSIRIDAETFIVQQRMVIETEYRVHTFEDGVIADLTGKRYNTDSGTATVLEANQFVRTVLSRLPAALVLDSFCGWDVARTVGGIWCIIEVNYAGVHKVFQPGFHCSGFLLSRKAGFLSIAKLLRFIEAAYDVAVRVVWRPCSDPAVEQLYNLVAEWQQFLQEYASVGTSETVVDTITVHDKGRTHNSYG